MKLTNFFTAAFVALLLCATHVQAATPDEVYVLTPAQLVKMKAAAPDFKKLDKKEREEDDDRDELSVEDYVRVLEKEPRARAILARHGMGTREFALATFALMHAAMYLGAEQLMDKKQAAEMQASFTKQQRANIALVRKTDMTSFYKAVSP